MMKLYVYDHCPYCVKARMIFGFKQKPFKLVTLLNDDAKTPKKMIGKKMVPILEYSRGKFMTESLDIIEYIDHKNPPNSVVWKEDAKLMRWLEDTAYEVYMLAMPRWVQAPLEEFKTEKARQYFQKNKEKYIGSSFSKALKKTQLLKTEMNAHLRKLEKLFVEEQEFFTGIFNIHDFHLLATLRSLSIVKGLKFPPKVQFFMQRLARITKIPLHHDIAL